MPSYTIMNEPKTYYYTHYAPTDPKQIPTNQKICIDRTNPSCIDYSYPGIDKTTHSKTSGFTLLSDINGFQFAKNDLVNVRIINITMGDGFYQSKLSTPLQWNAAFSAIITAAEMKKLGPGTVTILMDIYSKKDDTVHILKSLNIEFTP